MPSSSQTNPLVCVICGKKPQDDHYKPFCSKRCADVDLNRWLGGVYAIASRPDEEEDEASFEPAPGHKPKDGDA